MSEQPARLELFEPHINSKFTFSADDANYALELVEAKKVGATPRPDGSSAFALLFKTEKGLYWEQQTLTLNHEKLGDVTLFLVPIAQEDGCTIFEALFN